MPCIEITQPINHRKARLYSLIDIIISSLFRYPLILSEFLQPFSSRCCIRALWNWLPKAPRQFAHPPEEDSLRSFNDTFMSKMISHLHFVIVIVNFWFLERPQKRSRRNQLFHRRLTKIKSIGSGQDPESQAGRQSDGYGGWCLELRRGGRYRVVSGKISIFTAKISDDLFLVIDHWRRRINQWRRSGAEFGGTEKFINDFFFGKNVHFHGQNFWWPFFSH